MNTVLKVGAASALALAGVAAHASIATPTAPGGSDAILFAEVVNAAETQVFASYAGDTGVSASSIYSGSLSGSTTVLGGDANLAKLFAADTGSDILVYTVVGGQYTGNQSTTNFKTAGNATFITTTANDSTMALGAVTSTNFPKFGNLVGDINAVNSNINGPATSIEGTSPATSGIFDITNSQSIAYWDGANTPNYNTVGSTQQIYAVTAGTPTSLLAHVSVTDVATTSLSANGLTLSGLGSGGGGGGPTVPLPAAVWLLGSGLLGFAGVARRKLKV